VTADPILLLSWLVLAHLAADFLLQSDSIVADKAAPGARAFRGLGLHGLGVAICLVPVGLAFGAVGWLLVIVVTTSHVVVDRIKAVATVRVRVASEADRVGPGWTPLPGAYFALDQVAHIVIFLTAYAVLLTDAPVQAGFVAWVDGAIRGADPDQVHRVTLTVVVLLSLVIVNVRAGAHFVGTLVGEPPPRRSDVPDAAPSHAGQRAWTLRVGPLEGRVEADHEPAANVPTTPPPERVGEVIGILERLLVSVLVLARAEVAIGLVIAAKTIARFRQLDDRDFAEYYLLGTLASVAVAVVSALIAGAALASIG
jgi:hypothetical protein